MEYCRINASQTEDLWELHKAYKLEIGEDIPGDPARDRLEKAVKK